MALQGPFVVVADNPAPDVVEALQTAGAFPIIETNWADAAAALASVEPEGLLLADLCRRAFGSKVRGYCGRGAWRVPRQDAGLGWAADAIQRGNPILCLRMRRKTPLLHWSRSSAG